MRSSILLTLLLALTVGCGGAMGRTSARVSQAHLTGDHITLDDHINFETDSAVIVEDSSVLIDDIAAVLAEHTELGTVHIVGHTDATGDDAHNLELSQARAEAVVEALRTRGVSPQRGCPRRRRERAPLRRGDRGVSGVEPPRRDHRRRELNAEHLGSESRARIEFRRASA